MKTPLPTPGISTRQKTLSHLLSGTGLASHDAKVRRMICVALAEDAESQDLDAAPYVQRQVAVVCRRREHPRALPSQR